MAMLNYLDDAVRYEQRMQMMADEQYYRQMREAAVLLRSGDGKHSRVILERLHELHPDDVDVAINLGAAYILGKQYKRAIPVLEAAAQAAADNAVVWVNLAAAYLGTLPLSTREQQDKAIDAYQRALAIDPTYPNAHYNLGLIYEDRQDWTNARLMFQQALRVNPSDKDARTLLAKAERRLDAPYN
jgi:tetratricopeptide (TPR) repeat protein